MVELNCETDFVSRNKQFISLLQTVTNLNLTAAQSQTLSAGDISLKTIEGADLDSIKQPDGKTLADLVALNIGQIGENLSLKRATHIASSNSNKNLHLIGFTHPSGDVNSLSFGRYGVLMAIEKDPAFKLPKDIRLESITQQLCQHVVGMSPESIGDLSNTSSWPKSKKEEPKEAKKEGDEHNPYGDFESETSSDDFATAEKEMIHQPFIFDSDRLVRDVLLETGLDIKAFIRYEVGQ